MTDPVLIVEDAASVAASYAETLAAEGWRSDIVDSVAKARARLKGGRRYGAVLLDLMLPDGDGLTVLEELAGAPHRPPVVAVTSDGSIRRAVEATRLGAFDFLVKPASPERLTRAVGAAMRAGDGPAREKIGDFGIIGESPAIAALRRKILRVATSDATVFITGESGVGKELCAHAVHAASARAGAPFIALNCGAIPGELLESILFGHKKGAFTGAVADSEGAARAAEGGTLFLDEICEMAPELQTKLLRFLESSTVTPVGAAEARPVDVRIICATNRDPAAEMRAGRFREDLYYRLHVLPLHAPALRERGDDVLTIADHLLARFAAEEGKRYQGFSAAARAAMTAARWPGNVRELINVVRQAVVLGDGGWIGPELLPLSAQAAPGAETPHGALAGDAAEAAAPAEISAEAAAERLCRLPLAEVERLVVLAALRAAGGAPRAAKSLGVSPSTIYRKLDSWQGAKAG